MVCQQGHPIGVPFGQDPEDHVNDSDRAKLMDPIVEASEINGANVELVEDSHDLRFNHVPEGLEEFNREAI